MQALLYTHSTQLNYALTILYNLNSHSEGILCLVLMLFFFPSNVKYRIISDAGFVRYVIALRKENCINWETNKTSTMFEYCKNNNNNSTRRRHKKKELKMSQETGFCLPLGSFHVWRKKKAQYYYVYFKG